MKKNTYTLLAILCITAFLNQIVQAQIAFTNSNSRLVTPGIHSGCAVAIADWNNDGKDDIIRLDQGNDCYVEIQKTNLQYESIFLGNFTGFGGAWSMAVSDVDHNGYKDILAGGSGSSIQILMTNATGTGGTFYNLPSSGFFLQNATFADFNNDGWIDIFCCDDNAESHIYLNNQNGTFFESTTTINFDVTTTDDSGNYGSVWTDFDNDGDMDLYIAKCRQGVNSPTDGRRINVLFVNNGNGTYTEDAASHALNIGWQSWTASFGDIDNDGDMDVMVTNHDHESMIMQNDGVGNFTDITSLTGFDITDITPIESVMEDFDNDGWIDILATGSDARYYKNNGNGTFTKITGLFDNNNMESFAIGDLNHDGSIDIYGSYATIYTNPTTIDDVIWMNKSNSNNFYTIDLKGTLSNHDAIGSRVAIYGAWGTQIREVRAGESYGTNNSAQCHFGLGQATVIDSVVIKWPSGLVQTILNPSINQFQTVIEANCISPEALITASGSLIICTGQSVTLTAPAGLVYLWSDGTTNQSISVNTPGEYNVQVSNAGVNCVATSKTLTVELNPDQTPTIVATGETEFCAGGFVDLQSPSGLSSYLWSNGETTQNITVTQSGVYILTITGVCQLYASAPITVTVHSAPAPAANNVYLTAPDTANLYATGTTVSWYDVATGGTAIATGNNFTTPILNTTTTYYAEDADIFGGGVFGTGLFNAFGSNVYSGTTTNAKTFFTVVKNCTLKTVKVYTDTPGIRRFELRDATNTLLNSLDVNVLPDTQIITLNFALTPGTDYSLGTDAATNQAIPGWNAVGPRLKRNNSGVAFPYTITDALSITGNDVGASYYYYFYDWQVEKESTVCAGPRTPVTVFVTVGLNELVTAGINVYPNPANEILNIQISNASTTLIKIYDATSRLVKQVELNTTQSQISITDLTPGVYQMQLEKDGITYMQKLILQ